MQDISVSIQFEGWESLKSAAKRHNKHVDVIRAAYRRNVIEGKIVEDPLGRRIILVSESSVDHYIANRRMTGPGNATKQKGETKCQPHNQSRNHPPITL